MTRGDKLKIVMPAISVTILTFLYFFFVICPSIVSRLTHLSTMAMGEQRQTSGIFG